MLAGKYQFRPELPFSPGAECAGRIEALGRRRDANGGWANASPPSRATIAAASASVLRADRLLRIPDGVTDEQAAGLIVTYGTSLHALKDRARLKAGETLAVLGAAGGVGLAAVEIGHAMGARVIACASSADKLALASEHGAEMTLDYAARDVKEGLRALTEGRGADVIYDPVGGDLAEPALRAIAWQGRYLVVGFAAGAIPEDSAQPRAPERVRHPGRVLGFLRRARARDASLEHGADLRLDEGRETLGPCAPCLPARRDGGGARRARAARGQGQGAGEGSGSSERGRPDMIRKTIYPA